ncbi:C-C motif chemokine 19-like [Anguilla anguilla]|uniref:C-C motif chemokine 19-like n=1 Tax=Anguilla anguilla TaxID=7936 RepID=UPI0015AAA789|nr:C-C motif chemokine 19-like [Anguilla anguilla]
MHQHQQSTTMATGIAFCVSIFFLLCSSNVTRGELALDCCLKVSHAKIPTHIVRGYQRQVGGNGCDISAVVFFTRKGRNLCAPPGRPWVETLTAHLDKERKRCQDSAFKQGKRCRTLRF